MICPNCGAYLADGSDFCEQCGTFMPVEKKKPEEPGNPVLDALFHQPVPEPSPAGKKGIPKSKKANPLPILIIAALLGIIVVFFLIVPRIGVRRGIAGIPDPVQEENYKYFEKDIGGYEVSIYGIYSYEIEALVVHMKDYYGLSLQNRLSPRDAALAWGRVAELNDTIDFNWKQHHRWVRWKVDNWEDIELAGGMDYISSHLSNNHLIPANKSVKHKIKRLKMGDHIKLTGYLVNVDAENKAGKIVTWDSSTTRDDTGDGACEVIYVTDIQWLK